MDPSLIKLAEETLDYAAKAGADQVKIRLGNARFVEVKQRQGELEALQASTTRGLTLSLFVDGRFSSNSTSLLEPDALRSFVDEALAMTKHLTPDPHRGLADEALYGEVDEDIDVEDKGYDDVDMERRKEFVALAESSAREQSEQVVSATADMVTQCSEFLQIHSNGFRGTRRSTSFSLGTTVTVKDEGDRRPEDGWWTAARYLDDLPDAKGIGEEATRRALARVGARKVASERMTLIVENRAAGKMVGTLLGPLGGSTLQQRRSCFEDKLGEAITCDKLSIVDQPLIPRGLASRTFDGDGLPARALPVIKEGVLQNYFIDVYYGRKLEMAPTTGGGSNLIVSTGERSLQQLIAGVERGILVSGFLGGNANPATGDFSYGVSGFLVENGRLGQPVSEMNITDNTTKLWHRLVEVGNDPYAYSSWRIPSLVFDQVQFSGA